MTKILNLLLLSQFIFFNSALAKEFELENIPKKAVDEARSNCKNEIKSCPRSVNGNRIKHEEFKHHQEINFTSKFDILIQFDCVEKNKSAITYFCHTPVELEIKNKSLFFNLGSTSITQKNR